MFPLWGSVLPILSQGSPYFPASCKDYLKWISIERESAPIGDGDGNAAAYKWSNMQRHQIASLDNSTKQARDTHSQTTLDRQPLLKHCLAEMESIKQLSAWSLVAYFCHHDHALLKDEFKELFNRTILGCSNLHSTFPRRLEVPVVEISSRFSCMSLLCPPSDIANIPNAYYDMSGPRKYAAKNVSDLLEALLGVYSTLAAESDLIRSIRSEKNKWDRL